MGRHAKKRETDENYEGNLRHLFFLTVMNFALGELPNRKQVLDYINANIVTNFVIVGYGDVREPYNLEIFLESFEKVIFNPLKKY